MSSQRLLLAFGAILGGVTLLVPSAGMGAVAGPDTGHYIARPGHVTKVKLQGSNGYGVKVLAGHRYGVTVQVRKGGVTAEYGVQGAENGDYGADARLPGLGRVRFQFAPNGRQRRIPPPPWCEGPNGKLLYGVVRGRIRFSGEGGYTRVAVNRAKAAVETWPKMRCRYLEPGKEGRGRKWTASFEAFRETPPNVLFTLTRYAKRWRPSSKRIEFRANTSASRGPIRIFRSVSVAADVSSVALLDPKTAPENFTVTPPPPFSGTATFQRTPESVFSWEGDLRIEFPGAEPLALAGPAFSTHYCALLDCVTQDSSLLP